MREEKEMLESDTTIASEDPRDSILNSRVPSPLVAMVSKGDSEIRGTSVLRTSISLLNSDDPVKKGIVPRPEQQPAPKTGNVPRPTPQPPAKPPQSPPKR